MNQLHQSSSPYLLQHKDNPVHWLPWGEEALSQARLKNLPLLVSVGYSTCHWCHVMAHESFEDPDIASIMNEFFVCVKVDREERPDIDHFLMNAVQAMGVSGGWPLHCFLTPDLKPFYGGTYFPPVRKYGRMSWPELLMAIHQAWLRKRSEITEQGNKLLAHLQESSKVSGSGSERSVQRSEVASSIHSLMDKEEGGFGYGQKFPNTFLLEYLWKHGDADQKEFVLFTLRKMCRSGIYDHLAGGFFRYTVDRSWAIPHFEKMAYDHALMMGILSLVLRTVHDETLLRALHGAWKFWEENMISEEGLFFAALDADTEGEEGKYYLWGNEEIQLATGSQKEDLKDLVWFEMPHQQSPAWHLGISKDATVPLSQGTEGILSQLLQYRGQRSSPGVDYKCILGWNALMVKAYAESYRATGRNDYKEKAVSLCKKLQAFFVNNDHGFVRYRTQGNALGNAFLEDYAFLLEACLSVYQLNFDAEMLVFCQDLMRQIDLRFPTDSGLYLPAPRDLSDSLPSGVDFSDHSIPNANSVLAGNFLKLAVILQDSEWETRAMKMLEKACACPSEIVPSRISWFSLRDTDRDLRWEIKCKDPETAYLYIQGILDHDVLLVQDDHLDEREIQPCTGQVCYLPLASKEDFHSWYQNK